MANGILEVLERHCAHWESLLPMLEGGVIGTHEMRDGKNVDTTSETIERTKQLLAETSELMDKIEARNA